MYSDVMVHLSPFLDTILNKSLSIIHFKLFMLLGHISKSNLTVSLTPFANI